MRHHDLATCLDRRSRESKYSLRAQVLRHPSRPSLMPVVTFSSTSMTTAAINDLHTNYQSSSNFHRHRRQHTHTYQFRNCTQASASLTTHSASQVHGTGGNGTRTVTITSTQTADACSCSHSSTIVTPPWLPSIDNVTSVLGSAADLSTRVWSANISSNRFDPTLTPVSTFTSLASEPLAQGHSQLLYCLLVSVVMVMVT